VVSLTGMTVMTLMTVICGCFLDAGVHPPSQAFHPFV
jgi:hypothetical protein